MDPDVLKLFETMIALLIPVGVGGGVYVLITSFAKRGNARSTGPGRTSEELGGSVETLERIQVRLQELEERLDFMERVLPALREGKHLPETPPRPRHQTPV